MAIDDGDIRYRAATAVFALANRAAGKGREATRPAKGQWVANGNGFGGFVQPDRLREAVAYCEIAVSIFPEAFGSYTRAIILEELGDYDAAEAAFLALAGTTYEPFGIQAAERCRQHREGRFNPDALLDEALAGAGAAGMDAAAVEAVMQRMQAYLGSGQAQAGAAGDSPDEDAAIALASRFTDHLLAGQYDQAKGLLHSRLKATRAEDLREYFEALFEGEPAPTSAHVFDTLRQWKGKGKQDVCAVYITIDSENGEALNLFVAREGERLAIREIEWGRP